LAPLNPAHPIAILDTTELASFKQALVESRTWYGLQPPGRTFVFGPRTVTAAQMKTAIAGVEAMLRDNPAPAVLTSRLLAAFDPMEATGGDDGGFLYTGYYEPLIEASKTRGHGYNTPIYSAPDDTVQVRISEFDAKLPEERLIGRLEGRKLVPYWKRADIAAGKLGRHAKVIAWAKDPVDLFFVQVQGSSSVRLPDGSEKRIGYDGANGYTYKSIGKKLIEDGKIPRERISMQSIRAYLAAHPDEVKGILDYDESYVFFHWLDGAPLGVLGRPVTPGRSIATDARLFPQGALAYVDTTRPVPMPASVGSAGVYATAPLRRFVLNQDTGGAIKGAGRADFFWGKGEDAAFAAGNMKQPGRLIFFVPKEAEPAATPVPATTP
ncbi:MAG TPA: murein transglycosylase A, partial [bacterium]|nr:murein transglycosylase A [bacterium]